MKVSVSKWGRGLAIAAAAVVIAACGGNDKVSGTVQSKWVTPAVYHQVHTAVNTQKCETKLQTKTVKNASGKYVRTTTPVRTCSMKFDHWGPWRREVAHPQAYNIKMVSGEQFCVNSYDWFNAHQNEQGTFRPVGC